MCSVLLVVHWLVFLCIYLFIYFYYFYFLEASLFTFYRVNERSRFVYVRCKNIFSLKFPYDRQARVRYAFLLTLTGPSKAGQASLHNVREGEEQYCRLHHFYFLV